jgi:hypothetical protein
LAGQPRGLISEFGPTASRTRHRAPTTSSGLWPKRKGRALVVTAPRGYVGERIDSFEVFASLDALQSCDRVPKEIESMVRAELGDSYVPELDI